MYAEILIKYPVKVIDKYFTYIIPPNLKSLIKVGMKVKVPFNNQIINGFVVNIKDTYNDEYNLKTITDIDNNDFILNDELILLGKFIKDRTLCPLISAYECMLPSSLKIKNSTHIYNKYDSFIVLNRDKEIINDYLKNSHRNIKQIEILNDLLRNDKVLKNKYGSYSVKSLIDKGLIKELKVQKYRINKLKNNSFKKFELNEEQKEAYNEIVNSSGNNIFLLEGITGSGKTEVYLHLINKVIEDGKTAIMLVPEISLTTQIVSRFYNWFGNKVAVFHSALSDGEKYDEYLKIIRGEVNVVVGTRSAIFVPLKNIGIIIIDEEHSDTYKQENMPRYNAIEVAKERCRYHNCPLVLGSATPLLESRARALKGVYKHLKMSKRAGDGKLPEVILVDMIQEIKKRNFIFSELLIEKIKNNLINKEQTIILLNRRGYSTIITCSCCGYTYKCPNCDITLTYHKSTNNLRCHYCGYAIKKREICPNCKENSLTYLGLGTEKVENELLKLFPNIRIIRMDQDTTTKKGAHDKIIDDFKNLKYDVLLGTQMISKGLDFPNVTLVGVINADTTLNIPDFRSNERTFSLLYQASGRAGRSDKKGTVIIQTYNKDNYILNCVKDNNYNEFYNFEMKNRKLMKYPPFYYLVGIKIISKDYNAAIEQSNKIKDYLKKHIDNSSIILGPTTSNIFKLNNTYRFQIVIKYKFDDKLKSALKFIDDYYINQPNIKLEIDMDPLHI